MQVQRGTEHDGVDPPSAGGTAVIYLDHAATTPLVARCLAGHAAVPEGALRQPVRAARGRPGGARRARRGARVGGRHARLRAGRGRLHGRRLRGRQPRGARPPRRRAGAWSRARSSTPPCASRCWPYGGEVAWAPVTADGVVDLDALPRWCAPATRSCCVMAANNVTGALQPVEQIAALCAERGVPLHVDAVQAAAGADVRRAAGRVDPRHRRAQARRAEGRRRARRPRRRDAARRRPRRRPGARAAARDRERRRRGRPSPRRWPSDRDQRRGAERAERAALRDRLERELRPAGGRGRRTAPARPRAAARGRARRPGRAPAGRRRHLRRRRLRVRRGQRRAVHVLAAMGIDPATRARRASA